MHPFQTVSVLFHGCFFLCGRTIAAYYISVVFKEFYIVYDCFNLQYMCKFVVHFYGCFSDAVFNEASLNAHMILIANFTLITRVYFFPKKDCNILRLMVRKPYLFDYIFIDAFRKIPQLRKYCVKNILNEIYCYTNYHIVTITNSIVFSQRLCR